MPINNSYRDGLRVGWSWWYQTSNLFNIHGFETFAAYTMLTSSSSDPTDYHQFVKWAAGLNL